MIQYTLGKEVGKHDVLVVSVFQSEKITSEVKKIDAGLNNSIELVWNSGDFEGKPMQTAWIYTNNSDCPRVLLVGLGEKKDMSMLRYKKAIGVAVLQIQGKKKQKAGFFLGKDVQKELGDRSTYEMVLAIDIANYAFDEHKEKDAKVTFLTAAQLIYPGVAPTAKMKKDLEEGTVVANAVNMTRRLGNTPPSIMTPTLLAKEAERMAKGIENLSVKVLSEPEIKKLGMGCFLGVASGSEQPPKFIIAEYWGGKKDEKPIVLVGKGITFDSGGLSIKPDKYMCDMKFDMLGAATALGIIRAVAGLKLKKNIVSLTPACENMPGGNAYRPDDILTAMNGKTVHVRNTDAEGRLILSDALCYAAKYEPKEVIDFATLTGACMVAIGTERSGLFTREDKIADRLQKSSEAVGEQLWRLPLGEEYSESMKDSIADIKNIGSTPYGGASTAAAFLEFFTDYPWAHIDLSSAYYADKGRPWIHVGAKGFGVQTLVDYLR